jgi:hypothetical protein
MVPDLRSSPNPRRNARPYFFWPCLQSLLAFLNRTPLCRRKVRCGRREPSTLRMRKQSWVRFPITQYKHSSSKCSQRKLCTARVRPPAKHYFFSDIASLASAVWNKGGYTLVCVVLLIYNMLILVAGMGIRMVYFFPPECPVAADTSVGY